jgi:hypothetical protein
LESRRKNRIISNVEIYKKKFLKTFFCFSIILSASGEYVDFKADALIGYDG